ncbi:MAG: hypothetical protein QOJ39_3638 [Candidatus Eremiobacteraeota bacterium]|nr:hypothetical protein [Candidatus Eremiobacteraeota bacterium]
MPLPDIFAPSIDVKPPAKRPLKVYAFDPTMGRMLGNDMVVNVAYEPLGPGPVGKRFAVVDYDGSTKTFYLPVDLDNPNILLRDGLDPTESDPRFHQQMVYAVASETLERFEAALGRTVHWRNPDPVPGRKSPPNRLYLFPHAMVSANAFYSADAHGILFGYFRATDTTDAQVVPGQTIFTCLSHDIIAHEVTHAVVDGIRSHFTEPTNIDVLAFHEAFADLAALFRHFSHREALLDTLQRTGGRLYTAHLKPDAPAPQGGQVAQGAPGEPLIQSEIAPDNPLIELARQFGQVSGLRGGLRSALGTPANAQELRTKLEPHARGSILVAAVFDAYFAVYLQRTADLFRVFRAGGGAENPVDLPGPLATLLATEASRIAELFFSVCARALDYCPPVDVTFGDFLRAVITADIDLFPSDTYGVRNAVMQAFRSRGIVPEGAQFFSEDSLRWPRVKPGALTPVTGLLFGDPNGLTRDEKNANGDLLRAYARTNAPALGFDDSDIDVPSFHPMFRTDEDGMLKTDMIVEIVQDRNVPIDPQELALGEVTIRIGATLMIAQQPLTADGTRPDPQVRYAIAKHLSGDHDLRQRAAYAAQGLTDGVGGKARVNFGLLHGT